MPRLLTLTVLALLLPIAASGQSGGIANPTPLAPVKATEVRDPLALRKLMGNSGLTLQWIDWEKRGRIAATKKGEVVHLSGSQSGANGAVLAVEGDVLAIDTKHFILRGRIAITNTPDPGRSCLKEGDHEFAITQNRKYWRLREFEWCDELTDYVDIYF